MNKKKKEQWQNFVTWQIIHSYFYVFIYVCVLYFFPIKDKCITCVQTFTCLLLLLGHEKAKTTFEREGWELILIYFLTCTLTKQAKIILKYSSYHNKVIMVFCLTWKVWAVTILLLKFFPWNLKLKNDQTKTFSLVTEAKIRRSITFLHNIFENTG